MAIQAYDRLGKEITVIARQMYDEDMSMSLVSG